MHCDSDEPLQEAQDEWQSAQLQNGCWGNTNDILIRTFQQKHAFSDNWMEIEVIEKEKLDISCKFIFSSSLNGKNIER